MADYYISKSGDDTTSLTPATASTDFVKLSWTAPFIRLAPGDTVWVEPAATAYSRTGVRGHPIYTTMDLTAGGYGDYSTNYSDDKFHSVITILGWPAPGEPYYDERPAAGISAGWDTSRSTHGKAHIEFNATSFYQGCFSAQDSYSLGDICLANMQMTVDNTWGSFIDFYEPYYTHHLERMVVVDNCDLVTTGEVDNQYNCEYTRTVYHQCTWSCSPTDYASYMSYYNGVSSVAIGCTLDQPMGEMGLDLMDARVFIGNKVVNANRQTFADRYFYDSLITEGEEVSDPRMRSSFRRFVACYFHSTTYGVEQAANLTHIIDVDYHQNKVVPRTIDGWPDPVPHLTETTLQIPHETTNSFSAPVRPKSVKMINYVSSDARPGSNTNYRIRVFCNCHENYGTYIGSFGYNGQLMTPRSLSVFPCADSEDCIPNNLNNAFMFTVDNTVTTAEIFVKVSNINTGAYGGELPTRGSLRFVVAYPTSTGYAVAESTENILSQNTWTSLSCTISCDLTPANAKQGFGFISFRQTGSYPHRQIANNTLTIPDWYLYIDPVVETS